MAKNITNKLINSDLITIYKNEFKKLILNIKEAIKDNKELKRIFIKYYNGEKLSLRDNVLLKLILQNNLKLTGLSTLITLSFPMPGSTFIILFIIKLANKFNINLLPSTKHKNIMENMNEGIDNDNLIDIKSMSKNDWDNLQQKINVDLWRPINVDLDILPVKISKNKRFAAYFLYQYYTRTLEIINKYYKFNANIIWDEQKLKNVMAHESIHHYLASIGKVKQKHGYLFKKQMNRINNMNIGYTVTIKDDEFILNDAVSNKYSLYFYKIDLNNKPFSMVYSSAKPYMDIIPQIKERIELFKYDVDKIEIYHITKGVETAYGMKNRRKLSFYRYKDKNISNKIINEPTTKHIKTIDI